MHSQITFGCCFVLTLITIKFDVPVLRLIKNPKSLPEYCPVMEPECFPLKIQEGSQVDREWCSCSAVDDGMELGELFEDAILFTHIYVFIRGAVKNILADFAR